MKYNVKDFKSIDFYKLRKKSNERLRN
ncbi:hypothetical protein [Staphylococcus epidermidis]|nr:hypothetical protein [Staphylococcus epidermidis]